MTELIRVKDYQFFIAKCEACGLRFPITNNVLRENKCVHCKGQIKIVKKYSNFVSKTEVAKYPNIVLILDNIRSAWNVGSILRTCDAVGITKLYLCGISPTPDNSKVKKTSLGAEKTVEWEYCKDALTLTHELKKQGFQILAIEKTQNSVSLFNFNLEEKQKYALVLGHEVGGVDPEILVIADYHLVLPTRGVKNSLNVAVACGISLYELLKL
ncbi:RNA methyltransferase [Candidatus Beckwithbacteria bacterium]|nr:RNA methyltransferase [Candidatus Beckwithbacteria bacterium]